jgi:5'-nucleotidase
LKILYIDMDNVLVDFRSSFVRIDPLLLKEFEGHLDDIPDLFSKMDPMPDAVDSFNRLAAVFDTYILSTAPWDNPSAWSDKLNWVKKHLGKSAYKRLILSHHKNLNDGDFLVDDRLKNGVEGFKGEHIHFGTDRFPDWTSTTTYLINRT